MAAVEEMVAGKYTAIAPHLDERQRRVWLGVEAKALGRGGVSTVARATGVSRTTVSKAVKELSDPNTQSGSGTQAGSRRVRRAGAGRPRLSQRDPGLVAALEALVDPDTRGDPQSPLRWTCKSTRTLADTLNQAGHAVSSWTVAKLLHELGYSLQANVKVREGASHPDRDAQFRYLGAQVQAQLGEGGPVVSVDTKKKELMVGDYKNGGRDWQPKGEPVEVNVHDFAGPEGKAIPYGVYDVASDTGWVSVGKDHDTAAFAVSTLRRWWEAMGVAAYPDARRLLVCADGGGSNSSRCRLWKAELVRLAADIGLAITVCHLPPGTSKWNKIEHRLFAHISMNWRGRPLESHEVVVQLIAATTTRSGLRVHAELDEGAYPKGIKISDADMKALPLVPHAFHGDWNYTLHPEPIITTI
ncbi:MAG: ISAzo13 family transposase [Egibacteraceae bacterium]